MPENIKTVQFDGTVEQIENIKNRRTALNTVDDKTYPTTKAVKDYVDSKIVKLDQTYNPASENAQSGTAVAEAVESETTRADNTYANALKGLSGGEAVADERRIAGKSRNGCKGQGEEFTKQYYRTIKLWS